jgi:D-alanyl-D-alanine carboxypeptidase (penicillin-binding protein 5/6)
MFFPILVGLLISGIISENLNINPAIKAEILFFGEENIIAATVESVNHLPENTYKYFYPQNYLPQNKTIAPQAKFEMVDKDLFVSASSSVAIDIESGEILYSDNSDEVRPIASLSKLAAALTFLDLMPEWDNFYIINRKDLRSGGKSYIYEGDEVKIIDLFHLSLIASDNSATVALGSALGLSEKEFVSKMNEKVVSLGMEKTVFEDATGLSKNNISTAEEVAILAKKSFARKKIRDIVSKENYSFKTKAGRIVSLFSTDYLLSVLPQKDFGISGGKTGYTQEAGYCFAGEFFQDNKKIVSVILGAPTDSARFNEAKRLAEWVFSSFSWD